MFAFEDKPEFDEDVKEQYTIVSEKNNKHNYVGYLPLTEQSHFQATLFCNVTASSPPATHFMFYRGNEALDDPEKYDLTRHIGDIQGADLKAACSVYLSHVYSLDQAPQS